MLDNTIKANECGLSNNDFKDDIELLKTVLSMLKQKDKEIEKLKQSLARNIANNFTISIKETEKSKEDLEMLDKGWQMELEKKDKQIDLMAEYIFQNVDVEEDICNSAYVECTQETAQDITCKNCIKQYFERKSEEWKKI